MDDVLHFGAEVTRAEALCVFVHGRGQSPEIMVDHVVRHLPQNVAYVMPRAPGGVWYAARAIDPLTDVARVELAASLDQMERAVLALRAASQRPLLLAGFSQGACLSLEFICAGRAKPDAVAALTGCRVGLAEDGRPMGLPFGLPVYLTGADADPWIPVTAFAEAIADLGRQGAAIRADLFPGRPHEVGQAELAMLRSILADLASDRAPVMEAGR